MKRAGKKAAYKVIQILYALTSANWKYVYENNDKYIHIIHHY